MDADCCATGGAPTPLAPPPVSALVMALKVLKSFPALPKLPPEPPMPKLPSPPIIWSPRLASDMVVSLTPLALVPPPLNASPTSLMAPSRC